MQRKYYLLAPGPVPVPPKVLAAMSEPIIHHRAPAFVKVLEEVRGGLKFLFQTKNEVLILASSGTGAMEGAVTNTLCKGDTSLVVRAGKFGERWAEICEAYGVKPICIDVPWGQAVDPKLIAQELEKNPFIRAVFIQASETSTGVMHPIREIAEIVKKYDNTLLVVDAISGIGVFDLPVDKWGLDVVVSGSQKAFMLPPGLAFVTLSDKALSFVEKSDIPKYYFNFKKELKKLVKDNETNFTPAVSLIMGLREALNMIKEDGLEKVFKRHARLADATRAAAKALGLELYAPDSPSNAVTAIKAPAGIDGQKIVKILRDKHNITIAGGQSEAKGKIFRIAHMGYLDAYDIIMVVSALEMTLKELGVSVEMGKGVKAAAEILEKEM
ncbi:MAG TPA: alanine--glyoxylate aminotransferase family protein [Thermodesulfobacteriota bacterium]|jgi:aspartate aminotransferase-like enzyme|nr:alanine--glyoxylate aminotransferase family protein [Thermodesulfobacteriota bacterium]